MKTLWIALVIFAAAGCSSEPPANTASIKNVAPTDRKTDMAGRPDLSGKGMQKGMPR